MKYSAADKTEARERLQQLLPEGAHVWLLERGAFRGDNLLVDVIIWRDGQPLHLYAEVAAVLDIDYNTMPYGVVLPFYWRDKMTMIMPVSQLVKELGYCLYFNYNAFHYEKL